MYDYDLLVVGSANADLVIGVDAAAGGERDGARLRPWPSTPGGKGGNQAVAAARLGARTPLLAQAGDDDLRPTAAGLPAGGLASTRSVCWWAAPRPASR